MKKALIAFLALGFFFGFAATKSQKLKLQKQTLTQKKTKVSPLENFDFLYGQWELLNAQDIKSRKPSSLEEASLNFVLEDDIYLASGATKANAECENGVEFKKYSKGEHRAFIKGAKSLPLMRQYFADGKRDGIWTGQVLCKGNHKLLWSAALLTRRQLFLTSNTHVVELYRRDSVAPIRDTFTDSDSEVSTE